MVDVKALIPADKDELYQCLLSSEYSKFRLWPNVTPEKTADFLFERIYQIQEKGLTFVAKQGREVMAIMAARGLEWDTQYFGFKCAKIEYILANISLERPIVEQSLNKILSEFQKVCISLGIKFVSVSVDSWATDINLALQKANYKYILTWLDAVFETSFDIPKVEFDAKIYTEIKPEEIVHFKKMSSSYFKGGRFYLDSNFNRQSVDNMYKQLIDSSVKNKDIVFVYRLKDQPIGFFIYGKIASYKEFSNLRVATTRYLIVDPEFRNKKAGYNLFAETLKYLRVRSDLITSGLEANNLPSLNLHAKLGFKYNYSHNVYHWWSGR